MISMLNAIRRKIGPDISQQTLKPLILQLCFRIQNNSPSDYSDENKVTNYCIASFLSWVNCRLINLLYFPLLSYKVNQNLPAVFGPSLAHHIYTHFYAMIVGSDYEVMIHDMVLIFGQVPIVQKGNANSSIYLKKMLYGLELSEYFFFRF